MESLAPFFQAIEGLSMVQRMLIYFGTLALLVGAFFYFSYMPKMDEKGKISADNDKLEKRLTVAKKKARQLGKYRKMMKKEQGRFKLAMKALPDRKQIPGLLTSVSQSGQDAGLEFVLFQPRGEIRKDFFSEIPVSISVLGNYHNVGIFFDKVSNLDRVVNIQNIRLAPQGKGGKKLQMTCTAVTYRFVQPKKKKKKKRRRRRRR
jgi:type IV pilus assembly protein PilO